MRASVTPSLSVVLHAALAAGTVELCAALDLASPPAVAGEEHWVHLLPAGEIRTADGRGPYRVTDWNKLVTTSFNAEGGRLILDENHSTDHAAPKGLSTPAAGWIVELQHRADGLWGRVEWTPAGRRVRKGYRAISPALLVDSAGNVIRLLRASLVNLPNLKGLAALHQEQSMDLLKKLAAKLGLADSASEEAVLAAIDTASGNATALQARIGAVAKAVGVAEDATQEVVLGAIATLGQTGDAGAIVALQGQITDLTTQLNAERSTRQRKAAEDFVDGAIAAGKTNVKPMRDHYVARHMVDAAAVEKEINSFVVLNGQSVVPAGAAPGKDANGKRIFTDEQKGVIERMNLDPVAYGKTLDAQELAEAKL